MYLPSSSGRSWGGLVLLVTALGVIRSPPRQLQAQRLSPAGSATGDTATPRVPAAQAADAVPRLQALFDATRRQVDYLPGDVVVKFKRGTSATQQQRALMALRSRPSRSALRWRDDIAVLHDSSQPDATVLARQLAQQPEVEYAQPNYIRRVPRWAPDRTTPIQVSASVTATTPNDPDFLGLQWNFRLIDVPGAWDVTPGANAAVTVAVVDTGVTTATRILPTPIWNGSAFTFLPFAFAISPDIAPSRFFRPVDLSLPLLGAGGDVFDLVGHGTHVASTIAESANNGVGLAGMAYNARLMPVKVCVGYWEVVAALAASGFSDPVPPDAGGCLDEDIAAGIKYAADNGAKVINLSLGGPEPAPAIRDALLYAVARGAFVTISGGNDFDDGNPTDFPAAYAAEIDGVMSVGAVGHSFNRAPYSNTASQIEIVAPGGSTTDGANDNERYVWQITLDPLDQSPFASLPRFDRYEEVGYTGTSMAAPHVAALAALLMSESVTSPKTIEAVIKATAKDLGKPGRDDEYGYGLIQPRAAVYGLGIRK